MPHYTDSGGASDHASILCAMLGIRFCERMRDLPDRKLACITIHRNAQAERHHLIDYCD